MSRSNVLALAGFLLLGPATAEESKPLPWSFQPLREQALPEVKNIAWPQNRIDHFILAELEKNGLSPAPEADARTLARRLSFDLTGLPPLSNTSIPNPQSEIRNEAERLLTSPRYGERWARHWLDLARYADVTESWSDAKSPAWLYRDWVIGALIATCPTTSLSSSSSPMISFQDPVPKTTPPSAFSDSAQAIGKNCNSLPRSSA